MATSTYNEICPVRLFFKFDCLELQYLIGFVCFWSFRALPRFDFELVLIFLFVRSFVFQFAIFKVVVSDELACFCILEYAFLRLEY